MSDGSVFAQRDGSSGVARGAGLLPSTPVAGQLRQRAAPPQRHDALGCALSTPPVTYSYPQRQVYAPLAYDDVSLGTRSERGATPGARFDVMPPAACVSHVSRVSVDPPASHDTSLLQEENDRLRSCLRDTEETVRDVRRAVRLQQSQQQQVPSDIAEEVARGYEARFAEYEERLAVLQGTADAVRVASEGQRSSTSPRMREADVIVRLRERCANLNADCTRLKSLHEADQRRIEHLEHEKVADKTRADARIAAMRRDVDQLQRTASDSATLQEDVASERRRRGAAEAAAERRVSVLQGTVAALEEECVKVHRKGETTAAGLRVEIDDLKKALDAARCAAAEAASQSNEEARLAAAVHKDVSSRLFAAESQSNALRTDLRRRTSVADDEVKLVTDMNNELASRLEDAEAQLAAKRGEVTVLSSKLAEAGRAAASEIAELHESLKSAELVNMELAERLEKAQTGSRAPTPSDHTTASRSASARLQALEEERAQLARDNVALAGRLNAHQHSGRRDDGAAPGSDVLRQRVADLEARLRVAEERAQRQSDAADAVRAEADSLRRRFATSDDAVQQLQTMNTELLEQLDEITRERDTLESTNKHLAEAPSPRNNEVALLEEMNLKLTKCLNESEAARDRDTKDFSKQLADLQSRNTSLSAELKSLESHEADMDKLRRSAGQLGADNEELLATVQALNRDKQQVAEQLAEAQRDAQKAADAASAVQGKLRKDHNGEVAHLKQKLAQLGQDNAELVDAIQEMESRPSSSTEQLRQQNEALTAQVLQLSTDNADLTAEAVRLRDTAATSEDTEARQQAQHDESVDLLRREILTLEDQLSLKRAAAVEVTELLRKNDDLSHTAAQLAKDKEGLLAQLAQAEQKTDAPDGTQPSRPGPADPQEVEELRAKLGEAQHARDIAHNASTELERQVVELQDHMLQLRRDNEELLDDLQQGPGASEIDLLDRMNTDLTQQLQRAEDKLAQLSAAERRSQDLAGQVRQLEADNTRLQHDTQRLHDAEQRAATLQQEADVNASRLSEPSRGQDTDTALQSRILELGRVNEELVDEAARAKAAAAHSAEEAEALEALNAELSSCLDACERRVAELEAEAEAGAAGMQQQAARREEGVGQQRPISRAPSGSSRDGGGARRASPPPATAALDASLGHPVSEASVGSLASSRGCCSPGELFAKDLDVKRAADYCSLLLADMQDLHTEVHGKPAAGQDKLSDMIDSLVPPLLPPGAGARGSASNAEVEEGGGVPACYAGMGEVELSEAFAVSCDGLVRLSELGQHLLAQIDGLKHLRD